MSDLPRLLFCCFDVVPGPSATSRRLSEYVKGLSERFQVVVLSVKTPDHPHIEKYQGARLLRVPVGPGDLTARLEAFDRAVRRQLESEDYMLVHFFDPFGGLALAEKRDEYQYKLVYDACVFPSIELPFATPEPPERRLIARTRRQELFCLMSADAVIVGNPLTRDWVSTLGVERDLVHVLRAPVDLAPYAQTALVRPDRSPMNVLHLGSLSGSHGLELLVEALALARTSVALKLTVVGPSDPGWKARLLAQAEARGVGDLVELQEPVAHDDLSKVLAAADVGALTLDDVERSRIVGAPLSRLGEYLAAGRPVLAADTPSSRNLVPDEAAVWYRPGDVSSLAQALVQLGADAALRLRLGEAARVAGARWDGAKLRADLVALYTLVTGTTAPRARDDDGIDPNEVTELGRSRHGEEASPPRKRRIGRSNDSSPSGTSKVLLAREGSSTDAGARLDPPAVMGVLLAEERRLPPIPPVPSFGLPEQVPLAARRPPGPAGSPGRTDPALPPVSGPGGEVAGPAGVEEEVPELSASEVEDADAGASRPEASTDPRAEGLASRPTLPPGGHEGAGEQASRWGPPIGGLPFPAGGPPTSSSNSGWIPVVSPSSSPSSGRLDSAAPGAAAGLSSAAPGSPRPGSSGSDVVARPTLIVPPPLPPAARSPSAAQSGEVPRPASLSPARPRASAPTPGPAPGAAAPTPSPRPSAPTPAPVTPSRLPRASTPTPAPVTPSRLPRASTPTPPPLPGGPRGAPDPARGPGPEAAPFGAAGRPTTGPLSRSGPPGATSQLLPVTAPPARVPGADEAVEISDAELQPVESEAEEEVVLAGDEVSAVDGDASPPSSAINPWLAQLVHGYCPPGSNLFDRPVPPTTTPGRER